MRGILYKLKKILPKINIIKYVKRFFLKRKIKKHRDNKDTGNEFLLKIINFFIVMVISASFVYFNLLYKNVKVLVGSTVVLGILIFIILRKKLKQEDFKTGSQEVTSLILKDENEKIIKKWDIHNLPSLIIGKKTKTNEVDIDLAETTYSSLISREHAVMNNTGSKWYFEDIGSSNGSGIRRRNGGEKFKVKTGEHYRINAGDTIYIANTKLLVK